VNWLIVTTTISLGVLAMILAMLVAAWMAGRGLGGKPPAPKEPFAGTYSYRVLFPDQAKKRPRPEYARDGNLLVIRRFACLNCGSPSYEVTGTGPMWGGTAETRRCKKCGTVHQHILKRG